MVILLEEGVSKKLKRNHVRSGLNCIICLFHTNKTSNTSFIHDLIFHVYMSWRRFFMYRRPFKGFLCKEDLLEDFFKKKTFLEVFQVGILLALLKIFQFFGRFGSLLVLLDDFQSYKTCLRSSRYKRSVGCLQGIEDLFVVLQASQTCWRSSRLKRPVGGLLGLEDLLGVFQVQKICWRSSRLGRPVGSLLCLEDLIRVVFLWQTSWSSSMFKFPFGGLLGIEYLLELFQLKKTC